MKNFTSVDDIRDPGDLIALAKSIKASPHAHPDKGKNKTLGLLFFNPSLRTRLSTQKAALNLGMHPVVMNLGTEGWALEFEDGTVMDGNCAEHIKEAAAVVSQYCDIIAVRSFPTLTDRQKDEQEHVISAFRNYATVPVISLEGSTEHPLQAVADALTIAEYKTTAKPKVVLTWAPHPKALPHAVPNSFIKIMKQMGVELVIAHPPGYALNPAITAGTAVTHNQDAAFTGADFIYAKNWSTYEPYGQVLSKDPSWTVTPQKMALTNDAKFMHCLPVRRNMIVTDAVLDSDNAIVIQQANNRTYAAQAILTKILENEN